MTLYKFVLEQNARKIRRYEIIATDEEDAFEEYMKGNFKIIWSKTIDSEGFRVISQVEVSDGQEN